MKVKAFSAESFQMSQELDHLRKQIQSSFIDSRQVQKIADAVGDILQSDSSVSKTKRTWQHMCADQAQDALHKEALQILEQVALVEQNRIGQDRGFLKEISQLAFEMKEVQLTFDTLVPSEVQEKLEEFKGRLEDLLVYSAFQEGFFEKDIHSLKELLQDLIFCHHFPSQRMLDVSNGQEELKKLSSIAKRVFFSDRLTVESLKKQLGDAEFTKLEQEIFKILVSSIDELDFNDPNIRQIIAIAIMRSVDTQLMA